ncbi:MAG: Crp/Fnr family transcriptional regulator [Calditrichaeota bacterium]|nr:MAG: Crp/Fnr family transcriptional regulator [Calditrichota bacterium]
MDVTLYLKKVPIFAGLTQFDLDKLASLVTVQHYAKDNLILLEEDMGRVLFMIGKGKVKISQINDDGREVILSILSSGDIFGEMALLDGSSRSASVTSLTDSELMILRRGDFLNLLEEYPKVSINLLKELARRLRKSDSQIKSLSLKDATGKVAYVILRLAEEIGIHRDNSIVINGLPMQQDIANMAGTSRETVSRVFSKLQQNGLIIKKGSKLTITDIEAYKDYVS